MPEPVMESLELTPELKACIKDMSLWSLRAEGKMFGAEKFWEAYNKFSCLVNEATGIESEAYC